MRKSDQQFLFLKDLSKLFQYTLINYSALKMTLSWGERDSETQLRLMKAGVSKVKNPKDSMHLHRLAVDIIFYWNNEYLDPDNRKKWPKEASHVLNLIGRKWETLHKENRWGGFFKSLFDPNHFERYIEKYKNE